MLFLIPAASPRSLKEFSKAIGAILTKTNPKSKVTRSIRGNSLTLRVDKFPFFIGYSDAPHVLQESKEFAELFGPPEKRVDIATASSRFELRAGHDPNMDHFNDMIFICQAAESMGPIYLFDPLSKEFR